MSEQTSARTSPGRPGRIGPWRLLDIVSASVPSRGGLLGGAAILPEFGPPDVIPTTADPDNELPESNLAAHEQRQAIAAERARRYLRVARPKDV